MLEPTKKSPSALSLIPNPNRPPNESRSNRTSASSTSTLMRRARRQSIPSLHHNNTSNQPAPSNPVQFRAEPDSPISLHEWQRSINDRIKSPFPGEFYQSTPSPPPPVPKVPYGTVSMYTPYPTPSGSIRNTMPTSISHKSLSQSVTSNLSAALSSVTSPSSRRKSRALSPSDLKRVRDADQTSLTSGDSITPPATTGLQQGYFDVEPENALNAEKVLEQAMQFHRQRRNQQRFGGAPSLKSKASTLSAKECKDSTPSSPAQGHASPAPRSGATLPAMRLNATSPPNLSIASFEVLIKELEAEEEERKRKRQETPVPVPSPQTPVSVKEPTVSAPVEAAAAPTPQARARRPNPLNAAKRRSTGSILSSPLTPTFPLDKENSSPVPRDRKVGVSGGHPRRISVASFGSEQSDSKRNSAHELTFNFVDLSNGGCAATDHRASREYSAVMVRSNSTVSSVFGDMDESRRLSSYNFGRRGSVF